MRKLAMMCKSPSLTHKNKHKTETSHLREVLNLHLFFTGRAPLVLYISWKPCTRASKQDEVRSPTLLYRPLPVKLQRSHDEAGLAQRAPVVQHPQCPRAGPQRGGERRPVVCDLSGGVHQDVVGGGDDVGGVDPDNRSSQVALAPAPALHGHRLVLWPQETPPVPEETLLRIPVGPHLNSRKVRDDS